MSALKYGLNITKKSNGPARPSPAKKKSLFDDDSETEEQPTAANEQLGGVFDLNKGAPSSKPAQKPGLNPPSKPRSKANLPVSQYGDLSSLQNSRKHAKDAEELDPSIYDYDAAFDAIHAKDAERKAAAREAAARRETKFLDSVLASAEVRKRDQLRAKEKLLQREREAEGDEFADKEKFVTGAYKQQQEEMRRLEEEERRREEEEAKKKKGMGMQGFYRSMMEQDEKRHQETMAAAAQAGKITAEAADEKPRDLAEAELAQKLNEKGANIIIDDEGNVADKRQLLSAGLNVAPKPRTATAAPVAAARSSRPQQTFQGRRDNQRAVRERQSKVVEEQLAVAAKRAADEEAEERRKLEHAAKSRKTEADVMSAKERYLQRKKEREAAAAAAKGSS